MPDTEITELDELSAEKVSGVPNPANGTPWLLLKAADTGLESAEHVHDSDTDSDEADDILAEVTKAGAGFCGTDDCTICDAKFGAIGELLKRKLKAADRQAIPKEDFAIPEKAPSSGSYPINDENHARNALSRASGKPVEARVKAAVHRKYPAIKEADEPVEKSPGVPDESVAEPHEAGHSAASGQSGLAGGATAGAKDAHASASDTLGGESSYVIPAEAKMTSSGPMGGALKPAEMAKESWDVIEVVDKGDWMARDNPLGMLNDASGVGGPAWEQYDASTLDSAARGLAAAARMVDKIGKREATEAISGNASEWMDTFQLGCAAEEINQALCLVAGLAYHEAAAAKGAEKAGRRVSAKTAAGLRAARDHLTDILGDGAPATPAGHTGTEEDQIMATVTKEELATFVAEAAAAAVKADRKARKEAKAAKNANNGGDIDEGKERSTVGSGHPADDVNSVGVGSPKSGVTKSEQDQAVEDLAKQFADMRELVEKMASTPRQGGPVLDGVARGGFAAAEGHADGEVAKSGEDAEIDEIVRLEKSLAETMEKRGPDMAARAAEIGQQVTLAKLRKAAELQFGDK